MQLAKMWRWMQVKRILKNDFKTYPLSKSENNTSSTCTQYQLITKLLQGHLHPLKKSIVLSVIHTCSHTCKHIYVQKRTPRNALSLKIYLEKKHACLLNNTTKIYSTILRVESFYRRRQLFFQIVVHCC